MSDMQPKGASIEICGQTYYLLYTLGAIDEIQERTGLGFFDAMDKVGEAFTSTSHETLDTVCTVLSCLTGLTVEELKVSITWGEYRSVVTAMLTAFGVSFPEPDEDDEDTERDPMHGGA